MQIKKIVNKQHSGLEKYFDINSFLNNGFVLLKANDLEQWSSDSEFRNYLHNLVEFRRKLMLFFELEMKDKRLFN